MSFWKITKQTTQITFIGFSLFATSFIVSLFLGTAATHPILEPPTQLIGYAQFIVLASIALALTDELVTHTPKKYFDISSTHPRHARYRSVQISKSSLAK